MKITLDDLDGIPLDDRQKRANELLDFFSQFTKYKHGKDNPYLQWLDKRLAGFYEGTDCKERDYARGTYGIAGQDVAKFMNFWYPVSRHQPQILLRCAAALPDKEEQGRIVIGNYLEEIGLNVKGALAHYTLLEQLMEKVGGNMGGRLNVPEQAERMVLQYHEIIDRTATNPARATGMLAAIEHPALDISGYFHKLIELAGMSSLFKKDTYLMIHVDVEPNHIILSHGAAEDYMKRSVKEHEEVLDGFKTTMQFWEEFWPEAFKTVGYRANGGHV